MKKILMTLCLLACTAAVYAQTAPDWVTRRPVSEDKYIGIGMAYLSDPDCQKKATANAMIEIAAQISVNVESASFMHTVDVDGKSKELFEEKVKESVAANLEGQVLKGSYQTKDRYYVYYELDKKQYAKHRKAQRQRGISLGKDWYAKGRAAEDMHNYVTAIQTYAKGLEAIEPYLYLDLTTEYEGRSFDVAAELYHAYANVFSGFEFVQNVTEVGAEAFKPAGDPLAVCLSKNGTVIPNVMLKARFVTGDGELTAPVKTDSDGTAVFYITNVTSKQGIQNVEIGIDDSFIASLPASYRQIIDTDNWPVARFTVVLMNQNYTAYLMVERNDLEACESQVRSILANNYFEFTEDTSADLFVTLSTVLEVGATVKGELYDMNECFASMNLKIYDNVGQTQLLDYNVAPVRVLVPTDKSEQQTYAMCTRELMKRVRVALPKELKKLNINL